MMPRPCFSAQIFAGLLAFLVGGPAVFAAQKQLAAGHVPETVRLKKAAALRHLAATNELRLALALPLRDAAGLTDFLRDLYDPASPQFHRYLTPAEFTARFGPTRADYAALIRFAKTNGLNISATHPNRLLVDVTGTVADVERAFQLRMNAYRHPRAARNFFAPDAAPVVDAALPLLQVSGLDNFSLPHPNARLRPSLLSANTAPRDGSGPGGTFRGNDFRKAYAPGTALTGAGQSVALLQFDGFYPADITNYANAIGVTNPPLTVRPVDGGVATPGGGGIEVSLDIEMVLAMAPGIANIYVYEAPDTSPWVDLLSAIANDNFARQVSCSWGGGGPDAAAENIFLQMAAQGQTFFNATGDSAAFAGAVEFPSESPNITQVGGTTLTTDGGGNYVSETAWNWGGGQGSSGGISPGVAIPVWQLGLGLTTNHASAARRNLPDVALTADNVFINYNNGSAGAVGGTSVAAPLWAGFTALANQRAAQLAQPPVGFLNPAIYALARGTNYTAVFHDITTGNNTNAASPNNFYATPGFDLCTGLGTPAGTNLLNALNVPDPLGLLPAPVLAASGMIGGPFTPANWTVTLTNTGGGALNWSLGALPPWLALSAVSGTLGGGGATNLNLQLSGAAALPAGDYLAALLVTNKNLSRVQVLAVRLAVGQSIVLNGGFETGDFTAWTLVGDTVIGSNIYNTVTANDIFPGVTRSGNFGALLGESGFLATLTQNLPTRPGQLYQLSFWLNNSAGGGGPQQFAARWNLTNTVLNLANPPAFTWTNWQFLVTATGTNTQLRFFARNDPSYFGFDDVAVTPVPPVAFATAALGAGNLQMTWNALAGLKYEVDYTTNLAPVNWHPLGSLTAATNVCALADTNLLTSDRQRFYRLLLLP
jgi:hypothetical protein